MKSGTALRAVGAGWLRTKVVESGLPAERDREVLNSGLLLAFSEIEVRDRAQLVSFKIACKLEVQLGPTSGAYSLSRYSYPTWRTDVPCCVWTTRGLTRLPR